MAKYRILRRDQGRVEYLGGGHYWRELKKEHIADLDMEEIRQLNQLHEQGEKPWPWPLRIVALLTALLVTVFLLTADIVPFLHLPDLSFLTRSAELGRDTALASLKTAVVSVEGAHASGSGFNLKAEGLIVTNRHVVEDNSGIMVVFPDGSRYPAKSWVYVEGYDLALATIAGAELPHVQLSATAPQAGDALIFIGNPLGFDWTISEATLLETVSYEGDDILHIAGPVRPGSSGSPLFDSQGLVVGVIFASLRDVADHGLAIPAALLLEFQNSP